MSTATDVETVRTVLTMANSGESLRSIGNATGLLDKEIRLIVDEDRRRREAAGRSSTVGTVVPRPAPTPEDGIANLIGQAQKSDLPKVRQAAKRAVAAVDYLREVLAATEQERAERAERERKERDAKAAVAAAQAALDQAKAQLAEVAPKTRGARKGVKLNLTPEDRERRRQQAYAMQERRHANIAARKAEAS